MLKASQINLYEHSEVKVRLLSLYLDRYLRVLNESPYTNDVNIYDLFCSEGIYQNQGKGSPICILEIIKRIHEENEKRGKAGKFNCLFNDVDSTKIAKLKSSVKSLGLHCEEMGKLHYEEKDYKDILYDVISELKGFRNTKGFIFIDPYGYKDIHIRDIKELLKCRKTEVLLFLPTQFMFRFEKNGTPQCLKDFIAELLPADEWPKSETGLKFVDTLKEAFRRCLGSDYFVDSFIISRDKNQFFCLFLFTSHIYGFDRMLDAKWTIDEEEGRGWRYEEGSLFSVTDKSPNTMKFERSLVEFLKTCPRTNSEIYAFTLHNGHLPKHATQVLTKFQKDKRLSVITKNGDIPRRGSFYINYRDFKDSPDKIKIELRQ